jgi:hypothetical protein
MWLWKRQSAPRSNSCQPRFAGSFSRLSCLGAYLSSLLTQRNDGELSRPCVRPSGAGADGAPSGAGQASSAAAAPMSLAAKKREAAAILSAGEHMPWSLRLTNALDRALRSADRMGLRETPTLPTLRDPGVAAVAGERGELDVDGVGPCVRNNHFVFRVNPVKMARLKEK